MGGAGAASSHIRQVVTVYMMVGLQGTSKRQQPAEKS